MHRPATTRRALALFLAVTVTTPPCLTSVASSRTYVIPHVLEKSGRISDTPFTFDTTMFMTYTAMIGGTPGTGAASVELYLFDKSTGQPLRSGTGTDVCAPCTYALSDGTNGLPAVRKVTVSVDDEIVADGGFPQGGAANAFAVLRTSGDEDNVSITSYIVNSHGTPGVELSGAYYNPKEVGLDRVYVLPHVFEQRGRTSITPYTFDTTIFFQYVGGMAGLPDQGNAQMDLYLFDDAGSPMTGPLGPVCNPCTYDMNAQTPHVSVPLEQVILSAGGFGGIDARNGFAVAVGRGPGGDNVVTQGFVVNSHTSAFDLSVFGFDPVPIASTANLDVDPVDAAASLDLSSYPNPASGDMEMSFALAQAGDVTLEVFDAAGRKVASVVDGQRPAGRHKARWTPRDASGSRLPSGVYFGRLSTPEGSGLTRLVWLP